MIAAMPSNIRQTTGRLPLTAANYLRRCHECNQPLGAKDLFCPRCGAKQPREPKTRERKITARARL
jgi:rRNA maturation endonuclease Nob1